MIYLFIFNNDGPRHRGHWKHVIYYKATLFIWTIITIKVNYPVFDIFKLKYNYIMNSNGT